MTNFHNIDLHKNYLRISDCFQKYIKKFAHALYKKKASWLLIRKAKDPARLTARTKFYDRDKPNDWTSARS